MLPKPKLLNQRARPNPFINDNIRSLMRTRHPTGYEQLDRKIPQLFGQAIQRNFRREVKRKIRLAQREFVEDQNKTEHQLCWICVENNQVMCSKKGFTKDEQNVSNEFDRFLNSVRKSTTEKNSAQENSTWCPTEDPVISRKYPITDQFFFSRVEYVQLKDNVNSVPNNEASGIDKVYHLAY